jgi:hypothetical protein
VAGIGKTALLRDLTEHAAGFRAELAGGFEVALGLRGAIDVQLDRRSASRVSRSPDGRARRSAPRPS